VEKAILIPANPKRQFRSGQQEGAITAHEDRIREQGAVFWRLIAPGDWVAAEFPHAEIRKGYLYDVGVRNVTHTCDISWIRPMSEVPFEDWQKYSLGKYESQADYDEAAELFYVFNITAIRSLDQPLPLSAFRKYKNGEPVKLVRNYCIVESPDRPESEATKLDSIENNDRGMKRGQMKINLLRTDKTEAKMGHGVIFYFEIDGRENRLPVAFLDEYRWLHENPESVDVLLFELEPTRIAETGLNKDEIVEEVLGFVKEFLESKGAKKSRGKITTWWNA
jgi:hypothetical protein